MCNVCIVTHQIHKLDQFAAATSLLNSQILDTWTHNAAGRSVDTSKTHQQITGDHLRIIVRSIKEVCLFSDGKIHRNNRNHHKW